MYFDLRAYVTYFDLRAYVAYLDLGACVAYFDISCVVVSVIFSLHHYYFISLLYGCVCSDNQDISIMTMIITMTMIIFYLTIMYRY